MVPTLGTMSTIGAASIMIIGGIISSLVKRRHHKD